jgi:NAD(P)-dependent dehydrogenase (short-subunit alcohol dehydrogenase family)
MVLEGAVVFVTGAASGIGAALARRFAAEGAAGLVLADLDEAGVTRVAAELDGPTVLPLTLDVADPGAVAAAVDRAEAEVGALDLVCANAGVMTGQGLDAPLEAWQRCFDVNVLAHVHLAKAVVPRMVDRGGGTFLVTASAAGLLTSPGDAPYAATKHAAVAFAEWLAITYGGRGVRVHALCPQGVDTPMLGPGLEAGVAAARAVAAAGAIVTTEEVADAVVAGLDAGRFLILPHPEVATYVLHKAGDLDRWLAGLRRLAEGVGATG